MCINVYSNDARNVRFCFRFQINNLLFNLKISTRTACKTVSYALKILAIMYIYFNSLRYLQKRCFYRCFTVFPAVCKPLKTSSIMQPDKAQRLHTVTILSTHLKFARSEARKRLCTDRHGLK